MRNPQNIRKIVWGMAQAMKDDVRRRFCFGFTIENVNMTLWFCSRSLLVATPSFDFGQVGR